ncbi:MAG: hypothetical protein FWC41_06935 [Firmicutes bacterium]|nr:hypothetical protein [Bacillota bacterium]
MKKIYERLVVNAIISIILKSSEYKNKVREERRTKMEKPYTNFVNMVFDMIEKSKDGKEFDENELQRTI